MQITQALPMSTVTDEVGWLAALDSAINSAFAPITEVVSTIVFYPITIAGVSFPFVVAWLIAAGIIFTIYFGAVQRHLKVSVEVVRGKYSTSDDPGEVPHFQALTSALSGTVGLGNIAGVGAAMALGGPGATFWMIFAGLLGMATKFAECTLGVKYRQVHEDGTVSGGPFRYLPIAFQKFRSNILAKFLTGVFAVAILFFGAAGGNMFQANQTYAQLRNVTGGADGLLGSATAAFIFGLILAGLVALVIIGGIKSIGATTSKLVPAMGIVYVTACLIVIFVNIGQVPEAFGAILVGAFQPEGMAGGILGVMIVGFQRAAFSNEAGLGSAPIAHSAVKTTRPVSEGFVAMLEPLVDTVIICTMTALAIIIAGAPSFQAGIDQVQAGEGAPDGVILTSDAFATVLPWFPVILAIAVALFAFSTLITWFYYTLKAWEYLFGRSRLSDNIFRAIFLTFTVAGAVLTFSEVLAFADAALFVCGFVNLLGVYLLLPVIKKEMREYLADRKTGKLLILGNEPTTGSTAAVPRSTEPRTGGGAHDAGSNS